MIGKEQMKVLGITVSGGAGTGTLSGTWDLARWYRIIPTDEADTYDVILKDGDGDIILSRTGITGTHSEQITLSLGIVKSVEIANSSADGTFRCKFDLH